MVQAFFRFDRTIHCAFEKITNYTKYLYLNFQINETDGISKFVVFLTFNRLKLLLWKMLLPSKHTFLFRSPST